MAECITHSLVTFPLPEMDPCYFCEIIRGNVERWNVSDETELTVTLLQGSGVPANTTVPLWRLVCVK